MTSKKNPTAANKAHKSALSSSPVFMRKDHSQISFHLAGNPNEVRELMRKANKGDWDAKEAISDLLERHDPHYMAVLEARKQGVYIFDPVLVMPDASFLSHEEEQKQSSIQKGLQCLLESSLFSDLLYLCMDAIPRGISVVEIIWDCKRTPWMPSVYRQRSMAQFICEEDPASGADRLLEKQQDGTTHLIDPKGRLILHRYSPNKETGLANLCVFTYLCKRVALRNWVAFAEVFGLPMRIGKYGMESTSEDVDILRSAVANLGVDAAAIMPEHMRVEFIENTKNGGEKLYESLVRFLDEQVSKVVLGQTMSTDSGSSLSQALVHNNVRLELLQNDAKSLANTLTQQLIRPWVDLNFGEMSVYPSLQLKKRTQKDPLDVLSSIAKLIPLGLEVSQEQMREHLGIRAPQAHETLLKKNDHRTNQESQNPKPQTTKPQTTNYQNSKQNSKKNSKQHSKQNSELQAQNSPREELDKEGLELKSFGEASKENLL